MKNLRYSRTLLIPISLIVVLMSGPMLIRPASASTGIRISIVNAAGGVYWRETNPPDWNRPTAISGFGVYNGTVVEPECYVSANTVPGSTSHLWYWATLISGPGSGTGYVHDHFMGTPWSTPDRVISGVPACQYGAVYYQPRYSSTDPLPPSNVQTIGLNDWSVGDCTAGKGYFPDTENGRIVTTMGAWSVGRLGPIYAMHQDLVRVEDHINLIILYDPGSYANFFASDGCDRFYDESWYYATWLLSNSTHHLLILAGHDTYDPDIWGFGSYEGIRQKLFPDITGTSLASRVLVCSYSTMDHPTVLKNFANVMNSGWTDGCPADPQYDGSFNP